MSNNAIILTDEVKKKKKKYKCKYCEKRLDRDDLVIHIAEDHEDLIPQGYTPARVAFNIVNKKEHGVCTQCGKESPWNEDKWRYERQCTNPKCKEDYAAMMKARMVNKYGTEHLLNDEEQQKKMLDNRSISGEYKFKDGGIRTYVGSYERKLLEFYDQVLNVHSDDILTPGPTIPYEINGKKSFWITDLYYIPANLVHDVKDGGDNPNTRNMPEYRGKQDAKENAIAKLGEHNYIRLTNNNFQQLLWILSEIKQSLIDDVNKKVVRIHENMTIGTIHRQDSVGDNVYIVPCMQNNTFVKTVACIGKDMNEMYDAELVKGEFRLKRTTPSELKEYTMVFRKYKGDGSAFVNNIRESYRRRTSIEWTPNYFYQSLLNEDVLSHDMVYYDTKFENVVDIYTEALCKLEIEEATLNMKVKGVDTVMPVLEYGNLLESKNISSKYNKIDVLQDIDGYFAYNHISREMTGHYESVNDIPEYMLDVLNRR